MFDELLTLRHTGDFGGDPSAITFEWFAHPDVDGTPPMPLPDPDNGQLNGLFIDGHAEGCNRSRLGELGVNALFGPDTKPGYFD